MKAQQLFSTIFLPALTLARPSPQGSPNLGILPTCAQNAALQAAISSGCSLTDAHCFCTNAGFIQALHQVITSGCSGSDQAAACTLGNQACSPYGVAIPCAAAAQAATTELPTTSVPSMTVAASGTTATGSAASMSLTMTGTNTMPLTTSSSSATTTTGNGTWTATGGPSQYTGAAGAAVSMYPGLLSGLAGVALMIAASF